MSYLVNSRFDAWVARQLPAVPLFESWTGFCWRSLGAAKAQGSQTVLGLGSAHPREQRALIDAERRAWGLPPTRRTPLAGRVELELAAADRIMIQSTFSERTLLAHGLPAAKLVRLPLGVNVARFAPAEGPRSGPFRVLFLGQVTLRKGVPYLLQAWEQLRWQDAELHFVGQVLPDCQPVVRRYAGLPGVHWAGYAPDQLAAFQSADVFVCPSVEDGFGLVVTEAMACGLPVVVSDHTGAADLVEPGQTGFIVPYNDSSAYAAALDELRRDPSRRAEMGRAARQAVQAHTWDRYRQQLVELHQRWLD
jgi:glycosyltransferase involved in cell wall biosynthesis